MSTLLLEINMIVQCVHAMFIVSRNHTFTSMFSSVMQFGKNLFNVQTAGKSSLMSLPNINGAT